MMESTLYTVFGIVAISLILIGLIVAKLYKRSTKETAYVRTGFGGQKVILNGGAIIMPVFHEVAQVNMKTLKLEVRRENNQALITGDRLRVDVLAEFYVRVKPDADSISQAAQTLGERTTKPNELKDLIEGKFVDALRSVAAEMKMEQLHEKRAEFVQKVQQAVSEDLAKNGLELESVSLTGLDQTSIEQFNANNAFDAEGLLLLTQEIEERKKKKNDIERDTEIQIQRKNLEAKKESLDLSKAEEEARLAQEREIEIQKAKQASEIEREQAERSRESQNAQIVADEAVKREKIANEKQTETDNIKKEQAIRQANIEKDKAIQLAQQDKEIEISQRSKAESIAKADADKERAEAVRAEEEVITAQKTAEAERQKQVEIIEAQKVAERDAVGITVGADAEKKAALNMAEAKKIEANAEAEAITVVAEATSKKMIAEAEGQTQLNNALNVLSDAQIDLKVKLEMVKALPSIIEQSVKPIENIDSIKILEGYNGTGGGSNGASGQGEGSLSDQIANSALKYRAQAPLVDNLLEELGLEGGVAGLEKYVTKTLPSGAPVKTEKKTVEAETSTQNQTLDNDIAPEKKTEAKPVTLPTSATKVSDDKKK